MTIFKSWKKVEFFGGGAGNLLNNKKKEEINVIA